jgi:AcrR family transcriptional regulator
MSRRARRSTRDGLLAAAVRLIRRSRDAGEVTVRRVVQAAGANLNAVNYHFGSKEELVREAVRLVIKDWFRARGLAPEGTAGRGLLPLADLAAGFLFAEPVASRMALDAEVGAKGAGATLSRETLDGMARELSRARPDLAEADVRRRVWLLLASVHLLFLRPEGCREWLGVDPADDAARSALLHDLVRLVEA